MKRANSQEYSVKTKIGGVLIFVGNNIEKKEYKSNKVL